MPNRLTLGSWEAVGPFPAGMREHPLTGNPLSAFPREGGHEDPDVDFAFRPYGEGDWPSELPTGGRAGWSRVEGDEDGDVAIVYEDVDWKQLRGDHGWASLQYEAFLRTAVTVPAVSEGPARLRVDALQAVEYAFVPRHNPTSPVTWYAGDVYGYGATRAGTPQPSPGRTSNFARSVALDPGDYVLLVRALYEVRMFGDPRGKAPEIKVGMRVVLEDEAERVAEYDPAGIAKWTATAGGESAAVFEGGLGYVPDVLDGWLMGTWVSFGVRVPPGSDMATITVRDVLTRGVDLGTVRAARTFRVAPGQTRVPPLRIAQVGSVDGRWLDVLLDVDGEDVVVRYPLCHRRSDARQAFRMTYAVTGDGGRVSGVSLGMVVPPQHNVEETPPALTLSLPPVLLALHGAGVDVESSFWTGAMPDVPGMWAVLPSGRNEWGEDWHGGSMGDVWAARDALPPLLELLGIPVSQETLLIGHSNGGQGAWHAAARFPDRICGVIAVAGYTKIQDYVPYTSLTSSHYADPALMGILSSSLTPYNNDLYASNLASVPVLAVHGISDDNVPPRHGRAQAGFVAAWTRGGADIRFIEVPGGHWWDGILQSPEVLEFINTLPPQRSMDDVRRAGFTLTTANPAETGPKAGIRIVELATPGRLARLDVNAPQWRDGKGPGTGLDLHSMNVRRVEIQGWAKIRSNSAPDAVKSLAFDGKVWASEQPRSTRPYGPLIRLLASAGPLLLVVGTERDGNGTVWRPHLADLATRYAHDVWVNHRIDVEIITDKEALWRTAKDNLGSGNIIVFGHPEENQFAKWLIVQEKTPLRFPTKSIFSIDGRVVYEKGTGIVALHPHPHERRATPVRFPAAPPLLALVAGNDSLGLELACRLLPLRTGVPVPEWAVVSPRCRWQGAGGLIGAGWWDGEWGWSEGMSWMDRE